MRAYAEFQYATRDQRGTRRSSIWESEYQSTKYDGAAVRTMDLASEDYLIFEHRDRDRKSNSPEGKAVVSYPHLHLLGEGLTEAEGRIAGRVDPKTGKKHPDCFERVVGSPHFQMTEHGWRMASEEASMVFVDGLHGGAQMAISPDIIPADEEERDRARPLGEPAVRIYLNSMDHHTTCKWESFRAFHQFYQFFDLGAYARQAMGVAYQGGAMGAHMGPRAPSPQPRRRGQ